ncbi:MAG TPA: hypothetical protein VHK90_06635 [Thermoanaerobaculia bacterium]|nr:hypothetical protein [Thermoanaerobaculia bacterium]
MNARFIAAALALLLAAGTLGAQEAQTVLAPDSTLYTVAAGKNVLELTRRNGDTRETRAIPGTEDPAVETHPRLAYDTKNDTLFVVWHRAFDNGDAILLSSLNAKNEWSEPLIVASGAGTRAGLQLVLTHVRGTDFEEPDTTLLNVAWWTLGGTSTPEFAIVAFENRKHVSTYVDNLVELANIKETEGQNEIEDTGDVVHPPLTMTKFEGGVDVVFGRDYSTALTRLRVEPRKVAGNARMWRPVGRTGQSIGPARLVASDSDPVQAFISKGRVVLYTPDSKFRFIVYDNGKWMPIRVIELDESLTSAELVQQLRRTVDEMMSPATTQEE